MPRLVAKLSAASRPAQIRALWAKLRETYPGIEIERTFAPIGPQPQPQPGPRAPAARGDPDDPEPDPWEAARELERFFTLTLPEAIDLAAARREIGRHPEIEALAEELEAAPLPETAPPVDFRPSPLQAHVKAAPRGISAGAAWRRRGGQGEGLGFVDLELGWHFHHQDLEDLNITKPLVGLNCRRQDHGTAVLGIVAARGGQGRIRGIAPGLRRVEVASPLARCWGTPNLPRTIQRVARALSPGDVLLIEMQVTMPGFPELPVECSAGIAAAIRFATGRGVVVVEAAGNRAADLDALEQEVDLGRFRTLNPESPRFVDSGAILVAAATSGVPHRRHPTSSFGRRVDCYAWGEHVYTCGGRDGNGFSEHTDDFQGTSAAAAMIAGIALCVQGMAKAAFGAPYTPRRLRRLLRNPENGTLSEGGLADRIGVMPDLAKIVKNVFRTAPRSSPS